MLKKTINYTDFNGNQRTEDFYFNLSRAELAEWELRENLTGGLQAVLQSIISSNDGNKIMDAFRLILTKSYGVKSDDGRSFVKSPELSSGFLGSEAYSILFMELLQDPEAASRFINAIVPSDLAEEAAKAPNQPGRPQPQDHRPKQLPTNEEARPATQQGESFIPRPPHESGPGFQQGPPRDEGYNPFAV